jgi:hypothetical protein
MVGIDLAWNDSKANFFLLNWKIKLLIRLRGRATQARNIELAIVLKMIERKMLEIIFTNFPIHRQIQGTGHLQLSLAARAQLKSARPPPRHLCQRHRQPARHRAELHPFPPTYGPGRQSRTQQPSVLQTGLDPHKAGCR